MEIDRATFGDRQAEMTARWFENVKTQYGDVEAYIAKRQKAYLDRWREAGRFIDNSAKVLDIGGGNLYPTLIDYFKQREFLYTYLDVDPAAVEASRRLATLGDLKNSRFGHGFNDSLDFPDQSFDAVFSSHCIEHSIDLQKTLREINRVLVLGGTLLMAVPFGWEANPEHPYFLGPNEWISLVEDAGFRIRVAQIGREYPEFGEDYFISAEKIENRIEFFRIKTDLYCKNTYKHVKYNDKSVKYIEAFHFNEENAISSAPNCKVEIKIPTGASFLLPIFSRHSWSGVVRIWNEVNSYDHDLYSWFVFDMPVSISVGSGNAKKITIELIGASPSSRWSQFVFKGYMWR